jgi:hypothetical protein
VSFPNLFNKCLDLDLLIRNAWSDQGWNIKFRRNLSVEEMQQWHDLSETLLGLHLTDEPEKIS